MSRNAAVDGLLMLWGERMNFPGNRVVRDQTPQLIAERTAKIADAVRRYVAAAVQHRVPQVMVKVTGGGRGKLAIAAHFRYISKNGRLEMEDDRGERLQGKESVRALTEEWRFGGDFIPDQCNRREALNIMLSMPRGTDPLAVQCAAREFAQHEFGDHKYLMVLHDHQANPHVHLSVKMESRHGARLNPRKADLQRWRENFAEQLRGWGVEAAASSCTSRGMMRGYEPLWKVKALGEGRLRLAGRRKDLADRRPMRDAPVEEWRALAAILDRGDPVDRALSKVVREVKGADRSQERRGR